MMLIRYKCSEMQTVSPTLVHAFFFQILLLIVASKLEKWAKNEQFLALAMYFMWTVWVKSDSGYLMSR